MIHDLENAVVLLRYDVDLYFKQTCLHYHTLLPRYSISSDCIIPLLALGLPATLPGLVAADLEDKRCSPIPGKLNSKINFLHWRFWSLELATRNAPMSLHLLAFACPALARMPSIPHSLPVRAR